jgi:hypothetical protein
MDPYTTSVGPLTSHAWASEPETHGSTTTVPPFTLVGAVRQVVLLAPGRMLRTGNSGGGGTIDAVHFWLIPPVQVQICICMAETLVEPTSGSGRRKIQYTQYYYSPHSRP